MTLFDSYSNNWKEIGGVNIENYEWSKSKMVELLDKPSSGSKDGLSYGYYCGQKSIDDYDSKNYPEPVDGMDLTCFFHDKFFGNPKFDIAFISNIRLLKENDKITNNDAAFVSDFILSPIMYPVFRCVYYEAIVACVIWLFILCIVIVIVRTLHKKNVNVVKKLNKTII